MKPYQTAEKSANPQPIWQKSTLLDVIQDIQDFQDVQTTNDPQDNQRQTTTLAQLSKSDFIKKTLSLPIEDYILQCYKFNRLILDKKEKASNGGKFSSLFNFVWLLRAHKSFKGKKYLPALEACEIEMRRWSKVQDLDGDNIWRDWFSTNTIDACSEFVTIWEKSRYTAGMGPIEQAMEKNRKKRLILSVELAQTRPIVKRSLRSEKDYSWFVGVAGYLQITIGNKPIQLPCSKLGSTFDVSAKTISRYRQWAIEDGFIVVVKKHKFRSSGKSESTDFLFDVSKWDTLKSLAQDGTAEAFIQAKESEESANSSGGDISPNEMEESNG